MKSEGSTDSSFEARLESLTELFVDHADSVHSVAYRLLWNRADAEDVVSATFLQAFVHLDELRDADRARPWLLRIAYHQALTVLRRRRDVPVDPLSLAHHTRGGDPSDAVIAADLALFIRRAIEALPRRCAPPSCSATSKVSRWQMWPTSSVSAPPLQRCASLERENNSEPLSEELCDMNCVDMEAHLTEFLEGELDVATEAAALEHLATCPHCDTVLRQTEQLIALAQDHGSEPLRPHRRNELLTLLLASIRNASR